MEKHKKDKQMLIEDTKKLRQDFFQKIKPTQKPKYIELEEKFK